MFTVTKSNKTTVIMTKAPPVWTHPKYLTPTSITQETDTHKYHPRD